MFFIMEEGEGKEDNDRSLTLDWLLPVRPPLLLRALPFCHLRGSLITTFPRGRAGSDL